MRVDRSVLRRIPRLQKENIERHLDALVAMGPRWPSSPGELFSAAYMEEAIRAHVDEVCTESFEYPLYVPIEAGLEITSEGGRECAALGVQFSADGECEGELTCVGDGDSFDARAASVSLEGRVLLARTRKPYLLAAASEGFGVKGIVVISESPERTIRALTAKAAYVQGTDPERHSTSFPMVAVDAETGSHLEELCAAGGTRVRLIHRRLHLARRSRNVVGRLAGKSGRSVVVGAHYDTQINVPGAWDNAAGCAVLLDMARAAAGLERTHGLELVAFGCEESGIHGSSCYVRRRSAELDKIIGYFNLDSVSSSASTTLDLHTTPGLREFAAQMVHEVCGLRPTSYNLLGRANIAQDSAPFFQNGVESVWLHEEGNPHFHTPQDTRDKVDVERLTQVGGAIWTMCAYLALGGRA